MEGPIERVIPRVRILPPQGGGRRLRERSRKRFSLDEDEPSAEQATVSRQENASPDLALDENRPVGHPAEDETGSHLDLTA